LQDTELYWKKNCEGNWPEHPKYLSSTYKIWYCSCHRV